LSIDCSVHFSTPSVQFLYIAIIKLLPCGLLSVSGA
jgi:hypothetical protein